MIDQLPMFDPMTSPDTGNAISSLALEAGHTPPASPDGPMTESCGRARRRASRSAPRAKAKPRLTIGTYGPTFSDSPVPDGPLSSWESRLRRRLARTGSTECALTWKASATPAGRPLSRLVPSTRPTDATDYGLWPTPTTRDWKDSVGMSFEPRKDGASRLDLLPRQVYWIAQNTPAALWVTPQAFDASNDGKGRALRYKGNAPSEAGNTRDPNKSGSWRGDLKDWATVALWPTPRASANENRTTKIPPSQLDGRHGLYLSSVAIGMQPAGSSATTEKPGALNPTFVAWLMGFPKAWDDCAPTSMPKRRKG